MEYIKYIIFIKYDNVKIKINDEIISYCCYDDLAYDYQIGKIHPKDLKSMVIIYINEILDPIRNYFEINPESKKLQNLVKEYI